MAQVDQLQSFKSVGNLLFVFDCCIFAGLIASFRANNHQLKAVHIIYKNIVRTIINDVTILKYFLVSLLVGRTTCSNSFFDSFKNLNIENK